MSYFSMKSRLKHVFLKQFDFKRTCGSYRCTFHILIASGKSTLDGYDIMANNQNVDTEYKWDFHLQNYTVKLYVGIGHKSRDA